MFAVAQVRSLFHDEADGDLFREAITICKANPDPDGLNLADIEAGFAAYTLYLDGDSDSARAMLRHSHEVYHRVLGDSDARSLSTLLALVYLRIQADQYLEAVQLIKELTDSLERSTTNPELLACIRQMMATYATKALRGDSATVEPARKMADQLARTFGEHHYFALLARSFLAELVPDTRERIVLWRSCLKSLVTWGVPSAFLRAKFTFEVARNLTEPADTEKELRSAIDLFRRLATKRTQARADYPYALQKLASLLAVRDDTSGREEVGKLLEEGWAFCKANSRVPDYRRAFASMDAGHWQLLYGDPAIAGEYFADAIDLWRRDDRPEVRKHLAEALALHGFSLRKRGDAQQADRVSGEARRIFNGEKDKTAPSVVNTQELLAGRLPAWK